MLLTSKDFVSLDCAASATNDSITGTSSRQEGEGGLRSHPETQEGI
jgi:hypothetical protein